VAMLAAKMAMPGSIRVQIMVCVPVTRKNER
jgi:hypothetical protein